MRLKTLLSVIVVAVTLAVFMQTANHGFITYDDPGYVTANPVVKEGLTAAGFAWAFTTTAMSNWHPLTWLSHMLDVQLFGLDPRGHHLTSLALHASGALLLFLLLARISAALWQSFAVAALFALHPLHVESVAWIAERKDVLSFLFLMLTLHCYVRYVKKKEATWYVPALLAFAAGLMAKPMLVTLPLVLFLLDYWPLSRIEKTADSVEKNVFSPFPTLIKEKIPFFFLSAVSAAITIYSQQSGGAMASLDKVPIALRIENALITTVKYIGLMFWPHDLAVLYPFPRAIPLWQPIGAGLLLTLISVAVVLCRKRRPYLLTGWFWYLVTLLPVIGLVQVGSQALADRYTYIPLIGLFIACCWLMPDLLPRVRYRQTIIGILAVAAISSLTFVTWQQIGYWKDSLTLYRHTLSVTADNYLILNNLGTALSEQGQTDESILVFREALRINPDHAEALYNLGRLYLLDVNRPQDALPLLLKAISIKTDYWDAYNNLGVAYNNLGQYNETVRVLKQVGKAAGNRADIHNNLAVAYFMMGNLDAARRELETVRRLDRLMAQRLEDFLNSPRPAGSN